MGRVAVWLVAVSAAGCTALSGIGDLSVGALEEDASAPVPTGSGDASQDTKAEKKPDKPKPDPKDPKDASDDADASAPDGKAPKDATPDTATPDTGADTSTPDPVYPTSCKTVSAGPIISNGQRTIDPDGPGGQAPFSVYCDFTTAGGGWSLVFVGSGNQDSTTMDYTSASPGLLSAATEALLVYRNNQTPVGTNAVFALPDAWKTQAPFKVRSADLDVDVSLNGGASVKGLLRYGYGNFGEFCDDAWTAPDLYGRVCLTGTSAPFYNAFSASTPDLCPASDEKFDLTSCGPTRQFTISVR